MKKLFLSFLLFSIVGLNFVYAQCTPDGSITQPGYYPDCSTGLPHDTVGVAYSTVLQVRVLTDTNVTLPNVGTVHATVDSIVLNNVTGLPAGFTYSTVPASKSFPGGSNGCVLISGPAPSAGMAGNHPLTIYITAYGKIFNSVAVSAPDTITCYSIQIDPVAGIAELNGSKFSLSQNFPDPATKLTDIYYSVPVGGMLELKVYNLLGKVVYQKPIYAERGTGKITLDAKDFAPGIYLYNLSNGKTTLTRRMVLAYN